MRSTTAPVGATIRATLSSTLVATPGPRQMNHSVTRKKPKPMMIAAL